MSGRGRRAAGQALFRMAPTSGCGWRQADVGAKADLSQDVHLAGRMRPHRGRVPFQGLWRRSCSLCGWGGRAGSELSSGRASSRRMMDEGHAALVGRSVARAARVAWLGGPAGGLIRGLSVNKDRSTSSRGTRRVGTLLVIEVKTEALRAIEETLRRHDTKVRLASDIVQERFGWRPRRDRPPADPPRCEHATPAGPPSRGGPADGVSTARPRAARVAPCAGRIDRRACLSATYEPSSYNVIPRQPRRRIRRLTSAENPVR